MRLKKQMKLYQKNLNLEKDLNKQTLIILNYWLYRLLKDNTKENQMKLNKDFSKKSFKNKEKQNSFKVRPKNFKMI